MADEAAPDPVEMARTAGYAQGVRGTGDPAGCPFAPDSDEAAAWHEGLEDGLEDRGKGPETYKHGFGINIDTEHNHNVRD